MTGSTDPRGAIEEPNALVEALLDSDSDRIRGAIDENPAWLSQADEAGMYPLHLLMLADVEDRAELIDRMIQGGADPGVVDAYGMTALHLAARIAWVEDSTTFEALLAAGVSVNSATGYGFTPLHFAMDLDVIQFLVEAGADVNARAFNGETILHAHACSPDALDFLIGAGAQVNVRRGDGWTPLDVARAEGAHEAVVALTDHGALTGRELAS